MVHSCSCGLSIGDNKEGNALQFFCSSEYLLFVTLQFLREKSTSSNGITKREFKVLNLLEFNSKRKWMSVILRDEDGQILLLCKGADIIVFERLAKNGRLYEANTSNHFNDYGEAVNIT
ncbi:hypothetical protein GUJ93_ZPchr0001g30930 [Zizania palustris]|uniref:Uncharacterized protein n=1 Tax=Zizania palustris TaxID=103762 RepID=A0A8J5RR18_ZIZPA|nr:hypothetical protein GUJ93_ZPchr0001g30930 [Zizania palustris]